MRDDDFRAWVAAAIGAASAERRLAFARDTVVRVLNARSFARVDEPREMTASGWAAFVEARLTVLTASSQDLKAHLAVIDAGVLTDGGVHGVLLAMLGAIDAWADYLEAGSVDALLRLADAGVGLID